jgi:hypothetical protein
MEIRTPGEFLTPRLANSLELLSKSNNIDIPKRYAIALCHVKRP